MSANITATGSSSPIGRARCPRRRSMWVRAAAVGDPRRAAARRRRARRRARRGPAGGSSRLRVTTVWQARRNSGPKPSWSAIACSRGSAGARLPTLDDDDPARRALAAAAAGMGERDSGAQRGGQDRLTRSALDESLVGKHVDVRHAAATLPLRRPSIWGDSCRFRLWGDRVDSATEVPQMGDQTGDVDRRAAAADAVAPSVTRSSPEERSAIPPSCRSPPGTTSCSPPSASTRC